MGKQEKNCKCNIYKSITLVWYIVSIRSVWVWVGGCVCLNASKCFCAICWQHWLLNKNHLPAIFVPSKIADYRLHGKERKGAVKIRMMAYLSRCNTYLQLKNDWWLLIMSFREKNAGRADCVSQSQSERTDKNEAKKLVLLQRLYSYFR